MKFFFTSDFARCFYLQFRVRAPLLGNIELQWGYPTLVTFFFAMFLAAFLEAAIVFSIVMHFGHVIATMYTEESV